MYNKAYIIDDDEISIFLTESVLEMEQLAKECNGFSCAQQALSRILEMIQQDQTDQLPEIIFLDLNMPIISGWDLLDQLMPYESVLKEKCKIYILTSSVDKFEIVKAKNYGLVNGFLQKPLQENSLSAIYAGN